MGLACGVGVLVGYVTVVVVEDEVRALIAGRECVVGVRIGVVVVVRVLVRVSTAVAVVVGVDIGGPAGIAELAIVIVVDDAVAVVV